MDFKRALMLTLAVWAATMAAFLAGIGIVMEQIPPAWMWLWLGLQPISGAALSMGLFCGVTRLEAASPGVRWRRLVLPLMLAVAAQAALDHWLATLSRMLFDAGPQGPFLQGFAFNLVVYAWLFGFQALVFELLVATHRAARLARNAAEAGKAVREAQLDALRNELNPHMLFNTFNSLSSLVLAGRNSEARSMLERLADYMRACLEDGDGALVTVADELELIEAYLAVEAVRFAQAPEVRIDCPDALIDAGAPRLILQPLVENAMKYAVHPSSGAAVITISAAEEGDRLRLTVQDTGGGDRPAVDGGTGRGLALVARRLRAMFGDAAEMRAGPAGDGFRVDLVLPRISPGLEGVAALR